MQGLHAWLAIEGGGGAVLCRAAGPWAARPAQAVSERWRSVRDEPWGKEPF